MAKPEPETKRLCANCSAKFYDLNKDPIVCPKCQTVMELAAVSARRPEPVRAAAAEEEVVAPETADAEFVSLEEADAEENTGKVKAVVPESEDDIEIDETIEDDDDDDSTFIADEEEGDEDVTDIIGDVEDEEET